MAKINITKPTGSVEVLSLLSAFKVDNNTYVILDSEKMGSMGLPIIYVAKYTEKLEKIVEDSEWQNVKNYLKGIINGTSFEYLKLSDNVKADEAYYTPLTLPQASYDLIKSRYVVKEEVKEEVVVNDPAKTINLSDLIKDDVALVSNLEGNKEIEVPIIPNNNIDNSIQAPIDPPTIVNEVVKPVQPVSITPTVTMEVESNITKKMNINFESDKETFLKACENMFDALVAKYQKNIDELQRKEELLLAKERELDEKLKNNPSGVVTANNVSQNVIDISNLMPNNPNA